MPEQLLNLLKICLLVLLYLFFLRVLRAVWAEVSVTNGASVIAGTDRRRFGRRRSTGGAKAPQGLRVLQPPDWAGRAMGMAPHITIGRDLSSTLPISDNYLSHHHARIVDRDGDYLLEDLGSTNGTYLNRRRVAGPDGAVQPSSGTVYLNGKRMTAPAPLRRGDRVQAGNLVMEVT